ncbi:ORF3 [Simian torque teno virus 31]|uniref:ORF3 n=1 Tax=Simian torque teno virus 31 TaxID=1619219 RepID=A0A0C5I2X4_9VIRU|nr:ORF3 [Simian torque teno virus 31]AJP36568.1 ORF3 [Simian torque teno virus 31]
MPFPIPIDNAWQYKSRTRGDWIPSTCSTGGISDEAISWDALSKEYRKTQAMTQIFQQALSSAQGWTHPQKGDGRTPKEVGFPVSSRRRRRGEDTRRRSSSSSQESPKRRRDAGGGQRGRSPRRRRPQRRRRRSSSWSWSDSDSSSTGSERVSRTSSPAWSEPKAATK